MRKSVINGLALLLVLLASYLQFYRGTKPTLSFGRVVKGADGEACVTLIFSNGLSRAVQLYDVAPDRQIYAIEVRQGGAWTNVNNLTYCGTGLDKILVKPGGLHSMSIPVYTFHQPWRVGLQYWVCSHHGDTEYESPHEVWTDPRLQFNLDVRRVMSI